MDPAAAEARMGEVHFVDVRKAYEFAAGHVPGAIHITLQELPERVDELDPSVPIVLVCQIGQRSGLATDFLTERGFDAHNLEGGLERWTAEGYPLEASGGETGEVVDGWAETLEW